MRVGIYYTPMERHALTTLAQQWLGMSLYGNARTDLGRVKTLDETLLASITNTPRHYGFHATLKAPMTLRADKTVEQLDKALSDFSKVQKATQIDKLVLKKIGNFFALVPEIQSPALSELAKNCVQHFEPFRAELTAAQMEKRLRTALNEQQKSHLLNWGYPYVFDEFKFHLTLTGPVDEAEQSKIGNAIEMHFDSVLNRPLEINQLGLFVEENNETPFYIHKTYELLK